MKIVAIIQARMGSTRLPAKVMKQLHGTTVLGHVLKRSQACPSIDEVIVATTIEPQDATIAQACEQLGVSCFRGSEQDVLSRYYLAAEEAGADLIVRITSDCPLYDGHLLERMLLEFKRIAAQEPLDYLSNTQIRTFPRGLDTEIFTFRALERAHREATRPHEREHVTPYIYQHPERFIVRNFASPTDLSSHRWTLDTEEDFALISAIYDALYVGNPDFGTAEVLELLDRRPELVALNAHVEQAKL